MVFKRYADDFENEITVDEKGREVKTPVYHGKYFVVNLDSSGMKQFKMRSIILLTLLTLTHIGAGFVSNTGMNQFYIAFPYVLAFFPLLNLAASALRLPEWKSAYRRDEIGLSFERMRTSSIFIIIVIGIGFLGEFVYLISGIKDRNLIQELLYLIPELLTLAAALIMFRLQSKIQIDDHKE